MAIALYFLGVEIDEVSSRNDQKIDRPQNWNEQNSGALVCVAFNLKGRNGATMSTSSEDYAWARARAMDLITRMPSFSTTDWPIEQYRAELIDIYRIDYHLSVFYFTRYLKLINSDVLRGAFLDAQLCVELLNDVTKH